MSMDGNSVDLLLVGVESGQIKSGSKFSHSFG